MFFFAVFEGFHMLSNAQDTPVILWKKILTSLTNNAIMQISMKEVLQIMILFHQKMDHFLPFFVYIVTQTTKKKTRMTRHVASKSVYNFSSVFSLRYRGRIVKVTRLTNEH